MEVFEIWSFELWEVTYKSLLGIFREIVPIKEMFDLWEVKL